jgi:hypothetical protein
MKDAKKKQQISSVMVISVPVNIHAMCVEMQIIGLNCCIIVMSPTILSEEGVSNVSEKNNNVILLIPRKLPQHKYFRQIFVRYMVQILAWTLVILTFS